MKISDLRGRDDTGFQRVTQSSVTAEHDKKRASTVKTLTCLTLIFEDSVFVHNYGIISSTLFILI